MSRIVLLIVLLAAGGWWWLDRQKLTEARVRGFYAAGSHALLSRDAKAMCDQVADEFSGKSTLTSIAGRETVHVDKKASCEAAEKTMEVFKQIGNALGGTATLNYEDSIESIVIAPDKRSAQVVHHYTLEVAGGAMTLSGVSQDTVGVRKGRVVSLRSESNDRMQLMGQR